MYKKSARIDKSQTKSRRSHSLVSSSSSAKDSTSSSEQSIGNGNSKNNNNNRKFRQQPQIEGRRDSTLPFSSNLINSNGNTNHIGTGIRQHDQPPSVRQPSLSADISSSQSVPVIKGDLEHEAKVEYCVCTFFCIFSFFWSVFRGAVFSLMVLFCFVL